MQSYDISMKYARGDGGNMLQNIKKVPDRSRALLLKRLVTLVVLAELVSEILFQEILITVLDNYTAVSSIHLTTYYIVHRSIEVKTCSIFDILY